MRSGTFSIFLLILLLNSYTCLQGQYGYSPFVDSLMLQISDSSLSILNRQLSGDTSVVISGITDTIKTRHSDFAGNGKAAQFILEKFQSYGLNAYLQQFDANGQNVVATLTGTTYPEKQYIICAHYDDKPNQGLAPGADDNASGMCAVLEAARLFQDLSFPYTVKFIAFDKEEQGTLGSQYYANLAFNLGHQILGVINLDMIAWDSNGDFQYAVSTNAGSASLMANYIDLARIYQPILDPCMISITSSDHYRFWMNGFPAVLAIEDYGNDFNSYYHTASDHFDVLNHDYFLAMVRAAVASLASMAMNYRMILSHQPLENDLLEAHREVNLVISGPIPPDTAIFKPRLYFRMDDDTFRFVNPYQVRGDTFDFRIPAYPAGSKVSYYFAVQDIHEDYVVTLPEFGKGLNPPGYIPPPVCFSYYIAKDTTVSYCASGLPLPVPADSTIYKSLVIPAGGRVLDIDLQVSINHTNLKDINLFLTSPSGRTIKLSTNNGFTLDHYQNTVFDDEASMIIDQGIPPYNGSFRPEEFLAAFDDTISAGAWLLRITNSGAIQGNLTGFCLSVNFSVGCRYVDASLPISGDGLSWETAFTSISEANASSPGPGDIILIKPGTYPEGLVIASSGEAVVPLTTGVAVLDSGKVVFPEGTDLSAINLEDLPGQYYVYLYRSRSYNNGFFPVTEVNESGNNIYAENASFREEYGVPGDSSALSAMVCRPVIYRKYSLNPEYERVLIDSVAGQYGSQAIYIGSPLQGGYYDAIPANFNILDGLDMIGGPNREGLHLQNSSYNVICNSRIYNTDSVGVYIGGNAGAPANYNMICNNEIYNNTQNGIYIEGDPIPDYFNYTNYNHLINNDFYVTGIGPYNYIYNAIHINDGVSFTVIERNRLHDFNLQSGNRAAVEIDSLATHTLIIGNLFQDIGSISGGVNACVHIQGYNENVEIANNIFFDATASDDDMYALWVDGTSHTGSRFVHNTVFNKDRGILFEDYGNSAGFSIVNNIFSVNDAYFTHSGIAGQFMLSHNLYFTDPEPDSGSPYINEPGRETGPVDFLDPFSADFRLSVSCEPAICSAVAINPPLSLDFNGNARLFSSSDRGACELENKSLWVGMIDHNWHNPLNWDESLVPGAISNAILVDCANDPVIYSGEVILKGLLVKEGAHLRISANAHLVTH